MAKKTETANEGQLPSDTVEIDDDDLLALLEEDERLTAQMAATGYNALLAERKTGRAAIWTKLALEGEGKTTFLVSGAKLLRTSISTTEDHTVSGATTRQLRISDPE